LKRYGHEGDNDTLNTLECIDKFCCLGALICAGGEAEETSGARVRCAWVRFKELAPVLTSRGASLKVKGKVYRAYIRSVMGYASETWAMQIWQGWRERNE